MKMRKFNIDVILEAKTDEAKKAELNKLFNIEGKSEIIEIHTLNNANGDANITLKATASFMRNNYDENYSDFEI